LDLSSFITSVYEIVKSPGKFKELIIEVEKILTNNTRLYKYRPPGFVEIQSFETLYVIGDLHGDFETLIEFLGREKIFDNINNKDLLIVFLGDYIDRGAQQAEVLTSVLLLKKLFSDKILLLRGNHEAAPLIIPYPHDFPDKLFELYGERGREIYRLVFKMFQKIPYSARVPGKLLLLHAGPPSSVLYEKSFEEAFCIGLPVVDDMVLEEILWNDPYDDPNTPIAPSFRGAGVLFNEQVTDRALKLSGVKYIVRGHEPAEGYKIDHHGKVLTLFDSRIPSYGVSVAAYLRIEWDDTLEDITRNIELIT
jgi:protein phosphatase